MKKSIMFVVILLGMFSSGVTLADSDTQPPKIDLSSIKINKKSVEVGETIEISYHATDDFSGISWTFLDVKSPSGKTSLNSNGSTEFDEETGLYVARIKIPAGIEGGTWKVSQIFARDGLGHDTSYYEDDLPEVTFQIKE